ncbi:MAG: circularly permuted type 2 ATP-grasp protein [Hahellaceae bacterium]|nr:circularly permuted type 2 ATP-grasp protein [Hahellaceae bacterium]
MKGSLSARAPDIGIVERYLWRLAEVLNWLPPGSGVPESTVYLSTCINAVQRPLTIYAADLARGPDGRWWTLVTVPGPSGAGYVLEARLVADARVFWASGQRL